MSIAVGRYAPSPTGELHRGSLYAALASFLNARAQGGRWLLRIDDLDGSRVVPGMEQAIRETLMAFGLRWDGQVAYQSERPAAYCTALAWLTERGFLFDCGCTRREAQTGPRGIEGPIYPGTCRNGLPAGRRPRSVRARVDADIVDFADAVQGRYEQRLAADIGDFIVRRADGVASYQLATVVDDAWQGVTEVVRGGDLLASTPRQIWLQRCLDVPGVDYAHLPLIVDEKGEKLGKSSGALSLVPHDLAGQLWQTLRRLGQAPPESLRDRPIARLLAWAIDNWSIERVPSVSTLANWPHEPPTP